MAHELVATDPNVTRQTGRAEGEAPPGVLVIPGYEIVGAIARGGMGRVLRGNDLTFGRPVAIKVLLPECDTAAGRAQFSERR